MKIEISRVIFGDIVFLLTGIGITYVILKFPNLNPYFLIPLIILEYFSFFMAIRSKAKTKNDANIN